MKFAEIIRNAGLNSEDYPRLSNVETNLYDRKDRIESNETVQFIEPFFKENESSLKNFTNLLNGLENEEETIKSINVKVDIGAVILFYKTARAIVFTRKSSMNPLVFME